jgi:hypothetical protein
MDSSRQSVLLWNCRSLRHKLRDLQYSLCSSVSESFFAPYPVPLIIALTECHISSEHPLTCIPSFTWSTLPGTSHGGGLALLTHNTVSCTELPNLPVLPSHDEIHPNSDIMYRLIRFPHQPPFVIGVVYLSPSLGGVSSYTITSLIHSLQAASSLSLPVLVLGDFNLHHSLWLCSAVPSASSNLFAQQLLQF